MKRPLVIATNNRGKLAEFRHLLAGLDLEVQSISEASPRPIQVVEDGETFEANALKKAREVAEATGMLALADDSGLEVDALGGAPGVRSARFAGEHATDAENMAALLAAIASREAIDAELTARFVCVLALVDPSAKGAAPLVVRGTCEGRLTRIPRGHHGFGYDPIFVVAGSERTMAELSEEEKSRVSHRGQATEKLRQRLERANIAP